MARSTKTATLAAAALAVGVVVFGRKRRRRPRGLAIGKSFEAVFRARTYPHSVRDRMVRRHNSSGATVRHSGIGAR